jgi:transcription antitermination factor NusG
MMSQFLLFMSKFIGVKPTLSELEKFEESPEGIDLELSTTVTAKEEVGHSFATGDVVEVCEGELMHLQGKITAIEGNKITLIPKHEELVVRYLKLETKSQSHCMNHNKQDIGNRFIDNKNSKP